MPRSRFLAKSASEGGGPWCINLRESSQRCGFPTKHRDILSRLNLGPPPEVGKTKEAAFFEHENDLMMLHIGLQIMDPDPSPGSFAKTAARTLAVKGTASTGGENQLDQDDLRVNR